MVRDSLEDLVTLSQAAVRLGLSRQALYDHRNRHFDSFPRPVESASEFRRAMVFRWSEIEAWYRGVVG